MKKMQVEGGDKEILYSKTIKAGKRIYYLDVKQTLTDELYLAVKESKKVQAKNGSPIAFEKHKIFLYKEDFDKFMDGMSDVINYIKQCKSAEKVQGSLVTDESQSEDSDEIKLDIDF